MRRVTPDDPGASAPRPGDLVFVRYTAENEERLLMINLGPLVECAMNDAIVALPASRRWETVFCSEHPRYGGHGVHALSEGRWRLQAQCAWFLQPAPVA